MAACILRLFALWPLGLLSYRRASHFFIPNIKVEAKSELFRDSYSMRRWNVHMECMDWEYKGLLLNLGGINRIALEKVKSQVGGKCTLQCGEFLSLMS